VLLCAASVIRPKEVYTNGELVSKWVKSFDDKLAGLLASLSPAGRGNCGRRDCKATAHSATATHQTTKSPGRLTVSGEKTSAAQG
jgi:hypothetical protein